LGELAKMTRFNEVKLKRDGKVGIKYIRGGYNTPKEEASENGPPNFGNCLLAAPRFAQ
jgi:hypothetical protein